MDSLHGNKKAGREVINNSSHAPIRNLKFYLLPDSSTSIVFRTRAIVSVVYSIVFSTNPVKPNERCVAPHL